MQNSSFYRLTDHHYFLHPCHSIRSPSWKRRIWRKSVICAGDTPRWKRRREKPSKICKTRISNYGKACSNWRDSAKTNPKAPPAVPWPKPEVPRRKRPISRRPAGDGEIPSVSLLPSHPIRIPISEFSKSRALRAGCHRQFRTCPYLFLQAPSAPLFRCQLLCFSVTFPTIIRHHPWRSVYACIIWYQWESSLWFLSPSARSKLPFAEIILSEAHSLNCCE